MSLTVHLRDLINTIDLLEEEQSNTEYKAFLWDDAEIYVRYISQGKYVLVGYDTDGGFVDREGDPAEEGWFDFVYDPDTKEIEYTNISDENDSYFDERNAKEIVDILVGEFFKKFGTDWNTIYKNLKNIRKPFETLEKVASLLPRYKDQIIHSARIKMRRAGATMAQINNLKHIDVPDLKRWIFLTKNAIKHANAIDQWENKPANKVGRSDLQGLINMIVDFSVYTLMKPDAAPYKLNSHTSF